MLRRFLNRLLARFENDPVVAAVKAPLVSVLLGSYNRRPLLESALASVRDNGMPFPYEIIVVDGGSADGSLEWLTAQHDIVTIVQHGCRRPGRANIAYRAARGKYILAIGTDCLLPPGAIASAVRQFEQCLYEGERLGGLDLNSGDWPREPGCRMQDAIGSCLFLRSALERIGWTDEDAFRLHNEDDDLCLRLYQAGYVIKERPPAFPTVAA